MKKNIGFTLIELMIVVAIIGIIASVALPAYSNYLVKIRVSEGLNLVAAPKKMISGDVANLVDLTITANTWNSQSGGLGATSKFVEQLLIDPATGVITISFNSVNVGNIPPSATMIFTPYVRTSSGAPLALSAALTAGSSGSLDWSCSSSTNSASIDKNMISAVATLPAVFAPSECR